MGQCQFHRTMRYSLNAIRFDDNIMFCLNLSLFLYADHGIVADRLQHINLTVFDANECSNAYRKRGLVISKDSQLCVGGEKGRDSCVGDSGSALVTSSKKSENLFPTWKLLGVVSFGPKKCGTENVPGVYAKVRNYIDWTLDNIEE